jgi:hypothetical protein
MIRTKSCNYCKGGSRFHLCMALSCTCLLLAFSLTARALTNVPPLFARFSTNPPGSYSLDCPWTGQSKITFASHESPEWQEWEGEPRLNTLIVTDTNEVTLPVNSLVLAQIYRFDDGGDGLVNCHVYRRVLPTDAAITNCATVGALVNILGQPPPRLDPFDQFIWEVFTVSSTNTIEVLTVQRSSDLLPPSRWKIRRGMLKEAPLLRPKRNASRAE